MSLLAGAGVASATTINLAILSAVGNPAYNNDIIAKMNLNATFFNIDVLNVDTSTPTLAILDTYQAVMVIGNNSFLDAATLGTNLKNYIDQPGHGVVMTAASNTYSNCIAASSSQLCGTFQSSDYWAIEPATLKTGIRATLGTVYLPADPLLAGVAAGALGFDGGSISTRITGAVHTGATRVADWSDGTPLLVTRTFASGSTEIAVNFYPPSSDKYPGLWVATTGGGTILANAFMEAAGYSGSSGSPDDSVPEPATYAITATGLCLLAWMLKRRRGTLQCESAQRPS